jgi:hypothetical protein
VSRVFSGLDGAKAGENLLPTVACVPVSIKKSRIMESYVLGLLHESGEIWLFSRLLSCPGYRDPSVSMEI